MGVEKPPWGASPSLEAGDFVGKLAMSLCSKCGAVISAIFAIAHNF